MHVRDRPTGQVRKGVTFGGGVNVASRSRRRRRRPSAGRCRPRMRWQRHPRPAHVRGPIPVCDIDVVADGSPTCRGQVGRYDIREEPVPPVLPEAVAPPQCERQHEAGETGEGWEPVLPELRAPMRRGHLSSFRRECPTRSTLGKAAICGLSHRSHGLLGPSERCYGQWVLEFRVLGSARSAAGRTPCRRAGTKRRAVLALLDPPGERDRSHRPADRGSVGRAATRECPGGATQPCLAPAQGPRRGRTRDEAVGLRPPGRSGGDRPPPLREPRHRGQAASGA